MHPFCLFLLLLCLKFFYVFAESEAPIKPRARELGLKVGILPPGPLNAITDVSGVRVGHVTLVEDNRICTGVTAILPHGDTFWEKVPGAVFVGNAFGKLIGSTQVNELGQIETPILLTSTLSAPKVADFLISYMLNMTGNEKLLSINPLAGETNDGYLNDSRSRPITEKHVFEAIETAKEGPVQEGCVGAGTGNVAFGFKGGIGTSSSNPSKLGRFYRWRSGADKFWRSFKYCRYPCWSEIGLLLFERLSGKKQRRDCFYSH